VLLFVLFLAITKCTDTNFSKYVSALVTFANVCQIHKQLVFDTYLAVTIQS